VHNIGLIGKARSGKDSVAKCLIRTRSYTRLAFADPLKEMAISVDPYIPTGYGITVRLSSLIADTGWEYAKDNYPEVRRILQHMGQTVREYDDEFWITSMRRKLNNAEAWNLPVVITDVRYPNEAAMLRARGFKMVRVQRPNPITGEYLPPASHAARHSSETALDDYAADVTITNDGTLDQLYAQVSNL
jgi:hypothetical protein